MNINKMRSGTGVKPSRAVVEAFRERSVTDRFKTEPLNYRYPSA